jgi:hypothetical protein
VVAALARKHRHWLAYLDWAGSLEPDDGTSELVVILDSSARWADAHGRAVRLPVAEADLFTSPLTSEALRSALGKEGF